MSRLFIAFVVLAPSPVLAHVGAHEFGFSDSLVHSLSQSDHLLALGAVLALPVAAGVVIWRRFK